MSQPPARPDLDAIEERSLDSRYSSSPPADIWALIDYARRLEEAVRELDRWASSMPDAGFTEASPRWTWWYLRPRLEEVLGTTR